MQTTWEYIVTKFREDCNLSRAELADRLRCSVSTIANWENGASPSEQLEERFNEWKEWWYYDSNDD